MSSQRDRRFESARRKLHYRLHVMQTEYEAHRKARHYGTYGECWPNTCVDAAAFCSRKSLIEDIIREFGGRA